MLNDKIRTYQDLSRHRSKRHAVRHWANRKNKTNKVKHKYLQVFARDSRFFTNFAFAAWRDYFLKQKRFIQSLSNLATVSDHQDIQRAFAKIKATGEVKALDSHRRKEKGGHSAYQILNELIKRRKARMLREIRQYAFGT